jgi:hypothetical protein
MKKKTNRKSIYSSVYDLFSADLSSLIVSNFSWLCSQKKNFRFWGLTFHRLHKNRFHLSVFWYGISFPLISLMKWYKHLKSIWHTLFRKWPIIWFNTISWWISSNKNFFFVLCGRYIDRLASVVVTTPTCQDLLV